MLTIDFELTGAGWMEIRLSRDGDSCHLAGLSYLTPVLDDVIRAALLIATGDSTADALFGLEPGAQRMRFETRWNDTRLEREYFVTVATSDRDIFDGLDDAAFQPDWEVRVEGHDEIASAVYVGAKALEVKHGHAGYAEKWIEHPFPVRSLAALEIALQTKPLPPTRPND